MHREEGFRLFEWGELHVGDEEFEVALNVVGEDKDLVTAGDGFSRPKAASDCAGMPVGRDTSSRDTWN
jgi:hypothetical protein